MSPSRKPRHADAAERVLEAEDASLLDVVDNLLNKGVVLSGDLTIGLAHIDLIYARLSLLLSAADRVLPERSDRERVDRRRVRTLARRRRFGA
jgi:gas vesicle protein GvpA/GvpJ/GvpM family